MTWIIAKLENQGDAAFAGALGIHVGNARIEPTTPHDVVKFVLVMLPFICNRSVNFEYLYYL